MIRILIVDDHEVVRLGLRSALDTADDFRIVAEAATAAEAVSEARSVRPDVVLMDVRLGPGDDAGGINACRTIRDELPEVAVLMFSSFSGRAAVLASIMAGASGYLTKNLGLAELRDAIRSAAKGESLLDPKVTAQVLEQLRALSSGKRPADKPLSEREREVLGLVAKGLTNREIGERLFVSEHTVRNHVASILNKLGLSRRVQAATYAVREGIADDDGRPEGVPGSDGA
jgi:DNA-binding NarL/FixJ family response regulator